MKDDVYLDTVLRNYGTRMFVPMSPGSKLNATANFGPCFFPVPGDVHILIAMPPNDEGLRPSPTKQATLERLTRRSDNSGSLPTHGDFIQVFNWTDEDCGKLKNIQEIELITPFTGPLFFVRKEHINVLKNFTKIYHNDLMWGTSSDQQFVLVGSPGVGKSCLLALLCFVIAVVYHRPVVWMRKSYGKVRQGVPPSTMLFYEGRFYMWKDHDGKVFEDLHRIFETHHVQPWFFLDGIRQDEINARNWHSFYKLLATSGQFCCKDYAPSTTVCLMPFWRVVDLWKLASTLGIYNMASSEFDAHYFVSGGNLRLFLRRDARRHVEEAVSIVRTTDQAEMLLSRLGCSALKQIDRIRMRGVKNINKPEDYVDSTQWIGCVTSELALHRLVGIISGTFFEKLLLVAKRLGDDRLEGIALEAIFHASLQAKKTLHLYCCDYDNKPRTHGWEVEMSKQVVNAKNIKVKSDVIKRTGLNLGDFVERLTRRAANPSIMDYWHPVGSLCETIDGVIKYTEREEEQEQEGQEVSALLQVTKATRHKFNPDVLWALARPFVNMGRPVRYIAMVPNAHTQLHFRLQPVTVENPEILEHVPLYVARFYFDE